jgi:hypothetical protein
MPEGVGVVIAYSLGGPDVAEEDTVVISVEFEEENVGRGLSSNSRALIPAATATAPAPAYFRKRRLDVTGDLLDSAKELRPSLQLRLRL